MGALRRPGRIKIMRQAMKEPNLTACGPASFINAVNTWGTAFATSGPKRAAVSLKTEKVEIDVRLAEHLGPTAVLLHSIESMKPKCGAGSKVMARLCKLADEKGVTLALEALPFQPKMGGKPIPVDKLKRFYQKFGFKTVISEEYGDAYMFRYPRVQEGVGWSRSVRRRGQK